MQATVPQPFKTRGSVDRSGHLSMPGGQWEQNDKYVSADLHDHHYRKASIQSKKKTSSASTNKVSDAATTYEVPKSKTREHTVILLFCFLEYRHIAFVVDNDKS